MEVSGEFSVYSFSNGDILAITFFNLFLDTVISMAFRKHLENGLASSPSG